MRDRVMTAVSEKVETRTATVLAPCDERSGLGRGMMRGLIGDGHEEETRTQRTIQMVQEVTMVLTPVDVGTTVGASLPRQHPTQGRECWTRLAAGGSSGRVSGRQPEN